MKKILLTITFFVLISCKEEIKPKDIGKSRFIAQAKFNFDFHDTVIVNKIYNGKINYKNDLDTITTSLNNIKKYRYIDYYFLKTKTVDYEDAYLKKIVTDTFTSETNRVIPIYNIRFNKLGINYIDGVIIDEVSIENENRNKNGQITTRVITNEFRATKKVVVIDKKN